MTAKGKPKIVWDNSLEDVGYNIKNITANNEHMTTNIHETSDELSHWLSGGVNSPVRAWKGLGIKPMIASRGDGALVYDNDGRPFIDFCCSWGALIHGHAHPDIVSEALHQINRGSTFGINTEVEGVLAKRIISHLPSIERIRFVSSGTEATMSAVRLARGATGRDRIVKFSGNYHGHADAFLIEAGSGVMDTNPQASSSGVPKNAIQDVVSLIYNDVEGVRNYLLDPQNRDQIACVILEPIAGNMGVVPATPEFLQMLRSVTREIGALLIFDEVISGFRVGLGGAQGLYEIEPDLTCLGKIIGGGFPAAAFGGSKVLMDHLAPTGSVYQAGTLSGNPVAMRTGWKTITMLEEPGFYENLQALSDALCEPISKYLRQREMPVCINQVGSMFTLFFGSAKVRGLDDVKQLDRDAFVAFFRAMHQAGIFIPPSQQECWFVSGCHTEEQMEYTKETVLQFLEQYYR